jgi:hypothetical protein
VSRSAIVAAVIVFAAVFGLHFGLVSWQHSHVAAQWVRISNAPDPSAWARYLERGDAWFGYSYALATAFTAFALALTIRRRRAASGVVGGMTLVSVLYGAGCFLIGCCGSPMLAVYLSLFGASVLGFLKPLVAIITTFSVVVSAIVIVRRARASSCPTCPPTPSGHPVEGSQVESLTR